MSNSRETDFHHRRPQWRGERKAVLVRMPVETAADLAKLAALEQRSVSELAAELLRRALSERDVA